MSLPQFYDTNTSLTLSNSTIISPPETLVTSAESVAIGIALVLIATIMHSFSLLYHVRSAELVDGPTHRKSGGSQDTDRSSKESWNWWVASIVFGVIGAASNLAALGLAPHSILIALGTLKIVFIEIFHKTRVIIRWSFCHAACEKRVRRTQTPRIQGATTHERKGHVRSQVTTTSMRPRRLRVAPPALKSWAPRTHWVHKNKDGAVVSSTEHPTKNNAQLQWGAIVLMLVGITILLICADHTHASESWAESVIVLGSTRSIGLLTSTLVLVIALMIAWRVNVTHNATAAVPVLMSVYLVALLPALLVSANKIFITVIIDAIASSSQNPHVEPIPLGWGALIISGILIFLCLQFIAMGNLLIHYDFTFSVPLYFTLQAMIVFILDFVIYERGKNFTDANTAGTVIGLVLLVVGLLWMSAAHKKAVEKQGPIAQETLADQDVLLHHSDARDTTNNDGPLRPTEFARHAMSKERNLINAI